MRGGQLYAYERTYISVVYPIDTTALIFQIIYIIDLGSKGRERLLRETIKNVVRAP